MQNMLSIALSPNLKALLIVFGLAAAAFAWIAANKALARKMSGWNAIARQFPMTEIHDAGNLYKGESGIVGSISCSRSFTILPACEGVCLYPYFARRIPCLIPWSRIRRVSVGDLSILLDVDYERPLQFFLPIAALPTVKAKISPELFHRAISPFEVAKAAIKEGSQPRWLSWIAGQAIKPVEKQVTKEQQERLKKGTHNDLA